MTKNELRKLYREGRLKFSYDIRVVLRDIISFSEKITLSIGEISREEAIEGIKKLFCEKMDGIK